MTKPTDSQQQHLQQLQYFKHLVCRFRRRLSCRMFRFEHEVSIAAIAAIAAATAYITSVYDIDDEDDSSDIQNQTSL